MSTSQRVVLADHSVEVGLDHLADQVFERGPMLPSELGPGLRRVSEEKVDFGRAKIPRVNADQDRSGPTIVTDLSPARSAPFDLPADFGKGDLDHLPDGVLLSGRQHVV